MSCGCDLGIIVGLGGAILGALATGAVSLYLNRLDKYEAKKSLAGLIKGEIVANISLIEKRQHEENFTKYVQEVKEKGQPRKFDWDYVGDMTLYEPGIKANYSQLGILGKDLNEKISSYVYILSGIRGDIKILCSNQVGTAKEQIEMMEADLQLWKDVKNLVDEILAELNKIIEEKNCFFPK